MSVCGRRAERRRLCLSKRDWERGWFLPVDGGTLWRGVFYPTPSLPVNGLLHDGFSYLCLSWAGQTRGSAPTGRTVE